MNTSLGYSKKTLTDTDVLLSGGGNRPLSDFIGSISWDSTNKKITYTPVGSSATDLVTFGSNAFTSDSYALSNHTHTVLSFADTRNVATTPTTASAVDGIKLEFKSKANGVNEGTWNGLLTLDPYSDVTGGYAIQLGWKTALDSTDTKNIYLRTPKTASEWNTWRTLLDSSNSSIGLSNGALAIKINGSTYNIYAYATSDATEGNQVWMRNIPNNGYTWRTLGDRAFDSTAYLPLTGGTLTGDLKLWHDQYGWISTQDTYHGIAIRGTVSGFGDDRAITAADKLEFIEYSGEYNFRRVTSTLNEVLFSITRTGVSSAVGVSVTGNITTDGNILLTKGGTNQNRSFGIKRTSNNQNIDVGWNWDNVDGSGAFFRSADADGSFGLFARKGANTTQLIGTTSGTLTWGGTNISLEGHTHTPTDINDLWKPARKITTSGTAPYQYAWLCRFYITTAWVGIPIIIRIASRFDNFIQANLRITTSATAYGTAAFNGYILGKTYRAELYYVKTEGDQTQGYDTFDFYAKTTSYNTGFYWDINLVGNTNGAVIEYKELFYDDLPAGATKINEYSPTYADGLSDPTKYYWANVKLSASSSTSTSPTFNNLYVSKIEASSKIINSTYNSADKFLMSNGSVLDINNLNYQSTHGTIIETSADSYYQSPIPKYLWHDVIAFCRESTPTYYTSSDGSTWTEATLDKGLFMQKDKWGSQVILNDSIKGSRWYWNGSYATGSIRWVMIGALWNSSTCYSDILFETSSDGSTWSTLFSITKIKLDYLPKWIRVVNRIENHMRLTITRNSESESGSQTKLTSIRFLTFRPGSQGMGCEYEYPYDWDKNFNILPLGSGALGTSSNKWPNLYVTNINGVAVGTTPKFTDTFRKVLVAGTERLSTATNSGDLKFVNGNYTTVTWDTTNQTIQYDCNLIRSGTATSLTSLDVTKSFIYTTLSANVTAANFTLSSAMTVGQCLTVLVYNSGSTTITIEIPSTWQTLDGYTLSCQATKFLEISIVRYASGANDYIVSSKMQ